VNSGDSTNDRTSPLISGLLIGLAGLFIVLRLFAVAQPLGIDQSLWASAVRGLERGQLLYVDVWEQRPPGIYLAYWAGFSILGWTPATVVLIDVLSVAVTTLALYWLARQLAGRFAGAMTAALYAVLTMPAFLYGHGGFLERSVSETFIVPCVAIAAICATRYRERASSVAALGLGSWIGVAMLFKPNAALYFPVLLLWALAPRLATHGLRMSTWFWPAVVAAVGAIIAPAFTIVWLWTGGMLGEARIAVVDFNRWYVGAGFSVPEYSRDFADRVFLRVKTEPVWTAGVVGSLAALFGGIRTRRIPAAASLGICWGFAAVLVIIVNGARLYNSYFIQALAPLALMGGWWISSGWSGPRWRRLLVAATAVLMVAVLAKRSFLARIVTDITSDVAVMKGDTDQTAYLERFGGYANGRGYSARANAELAAYVHNRTTPDDRVFLFGINGAGLYFLADRLPAQRFLRVNFFEPQDFPDPRFRLAAVAAELQARQPVYLIFERLHSTADAQVALTVDALPQNPALQPLLEHYTLEAQIEDFTLYRRRSLRAGLSTSDSSTGVPRENTSPR
jgi:hypothetical protein